jgi:hypothetical protein
MMIIIQQDTRPTTIHKMGADRRTAPVQKFPSTDPVQREREARERREYWEKINT